MLTKCSEIHQELYFRSKKQFGIDFIDVSSSFPPHCDCLETLYIVQTEGEPLKMFTLEIN